jgi:hypothetical protein
MSLTPYLLEYSVLENVARLVAYKSEYLNNFVSNKMRTHFRFSCVSKISFEPGSDSWPTISIAYVPGFCYLYGCRKGMVRSIIYTHTALIHAELRVYECHFAFLWGLQPPYTQHGGRPPPYA